MDNKSRAEKEILSRLAAIEDRLCLIANILLILFGGACGYLLSLIVKIVL